MSLVWAILAFYVLLAITIGSFYEINKPTLIGRIEQPSVVSSFGIFYLYLYISTPIIMLVSLLDIDPTALGFQPVAAILGLSVSSLSVVLFVGAKLQIGKDFSPCHQAYLPKDIVREGIYAHIRHPIYTSMLLFFVGITIATLHWLAMLNLVILYAYYRKSAQLEESALLANFDEYKAYQKVTGRFLPKLSREFRIDTAYSAVVEKKQFKN